MRAIRTCRIFYVRQIGDPACAGFLAKRGNNGAKLGEVGCVDRIAILSTQVHDRPDLQGAERVAAKHVEELASSSKFAELAV